MKNSLHNIDTKVFNDEGREIPIIVMGLNIHDPESIGAFMDYAMQQVQNQRMCSPTDTQMLTITIAGYLTAQEFASLWNSRLGELPVLKHFMMQMKSADILHIAKGQLLESASLI